GVRRSGLGRRTAGRPKDRLRDGPAAFRFAPLPDSVRCSRKEMGPLFGVGLRRQRRVHAADAFALRGLLLKRRSGEGLKPGKAVGTAKHANAEKIGREEGFPSG